MTDDVWGEEDEETTFAQGRVPDRTYVSKNFALERESSSDFGQPARFIHKVFDPEHESAIHYDGTEWVISETEKGRYQFKLLVAREAGRVKELWIQRVPAEGSSGRLKLLLNLRRPDVVRLVELLRNLDYIPVEGDKTVRVDDALVRDLFASPGSLVSVYRRDPDRFRKLITDDESARDVIALARRRSQVQTFQRLLEDSDFFDAEVARVPSKRKEDVWQRFFEANPWILGVTQPGQLLTSWSDERLEQVVVGPSVAGVGKCTDALLRTSGRIRSMVFVEFKTHRTALLGKEYRSGCWSPSDEVTGGVAQVQGTVHRAVSQIGERLADLTGDGSEVPGEYTYLLRPRSFLVAGQLNELIGQHGGHHQDRVRSFELYRRHLAEPDIVTFDELLARARWFVETSDADLRIRPRRRASL